MKPHRCIVIFLLILILPFSFVYGDNQNLAQPHLAAAKTFLDKKDYPQALKSLQTVLKLNAVPEVYYYLGICYEGLLQYENALAAYQKYSGTDSGVKTSIRERLYQVIANHYLKNIEASLQRKDFKKAFDELERVAKIGLFPAVVRLLGILHVELHYYPKARRYFKQFLAMTLADSEKNRLLPDVKLRLQQLETQMARDYFDQGQKNHQKNDFKRALLLYQKALELRPTDPAIPKAIAQLKLDEMAYQKKLVRQTELQKHLNRLEKEYLLVVQALQQKRKSRQLMGILMTTASGVVALIAGTLFVMMKKSTDDAHYYKNKYNAATDQTDMDSNYDKMLSKITDHDNYLISGIACASIAVIFLGVGIYSFFARPKIPSFEEFRRKIKISIQPLHGPNGKLVGLNSGLTFRF